MSDCDINGHVWEVAAHSIGLENKTWQCAICGKEKPFIPPASDPRDAVIRQCKEALDIADQWMEAIDREGFKMGRGWRPDRKKIRQALSAIKEIE